MRHRYSLLLFLAFTATARVSGAQATIDPGMTKAQVISKLGQPVAERTTGIYPPSCSTRTAQSARSV